MSSSAPFPPSLFSKLIDEAHGFLCHQSLLHQSDQAEGALETVQARRPRLPWLRSRRTRAEFARALASARATHQAAQSQLERLTRLEAWLRDGIRAGLDGYLSAASSDYQILGQLRVIESLWSHQVGRLGKMMLIAAREIKATLAGIQTTATPTAGGVLAPATFAPLRAAISGAQRAAVQVHDLAHEFAIVARGRFADDAQLPVLPRLPNLAWIDCLAAMERSAVTAELTKMEAAAREFFHAEMDRLCAEGEMLGMRCEVARATYLERYWRELRQHILEHHTVPQGTTEALMRLEAKRAAEVARAEALPRTDGSFGADR